MSYTGSFLLGTLSAVVTLAQTNVTLDIAIKIESPMSSNSFILAQTGSVGALGSGTLVSASSLWPINNGTLGGPAQVGLQLSFNAADSISISYVENDPMFDFAQTVAFSGGTITGGTGAYAGATGSLDLSLVKDGTTRYAQATTTGSGTVTVGGVTTPLSLSGFRGWCCGYPTRERDFYTDTVTASGTFGNGTGTLTGYYYLNPPLNVTGTGKFAFSSTDSITLWFTYTPVSSSDNSPNGSFTGFIEGGTGKYANVGGQLTFTFKNEALHATGTINTFNDVGTITQVKTAYGGPQVAYNTWLEIHGKNLVPPDTPAAGVDWSNAPEFANGQMPTKLGPIGVSINGLSAFVYFYCSAATNPSCADDQINVLAPTLGTVNPSPAVVIVGNGGSTSAPFVTFRAGYSPAFFSLDVAGHVAARHLDASLVGPASLYPGSTTPAKAGETISIYGTGFGPPTNGPIVSGSATQSGPLLPDTGGLSCFISGISAHTVGALVGPGLYQFNITIPNGVKSGDNPVNCIYAVYPTSPGALIAVQ